MAVFDHLVVGAGFAGAVLAERLASQLGRRVLVVDKRPHVGGNAFDEHDAAGILVHRYGPHLFHTNSERIVRYLSQFTAWRPYEYRALTSVEGRLLPFPVNLDTVNRLYDLAMTSSELEAFFARVRVPNPRPRNAEEMVTSQVGRDLYEKFFRGYTRKQWGRDPSELDVSVTARVPARTDRDDRYFTDVFQAIPQHGYTALFQRMLDHPSIRVEVGTSFREIASRVRFDELIWTGPIDEFYGHRFGPLPYRSLQFQFETHDHEWFQPAAAVHYPNDHDWTRITEAKHITGQLHPQTTITREFPTSEGDPYYPIPCADARRRYERYRELARATPDVRMVGRLATYRYLNMDQVVGQALATFDAIAGKRAAAALPHLAMGGSAAALPAVQGEGQ